MRSREQNLTGTVLDVLDEVRRAMNADPDFKVQWTDHANPEHYRVPWTSNKRIGIAGAILLGDTGANFQDCYAAVWEAIQGRPGTGDPEPPSEIRVTITVRGGDVLIDTASNPVVR